MVQARLAIPHALSHFSHGLVFTMALGLVACSSDDGGGDDHALAGSGGQSPGTGAAASSGGTAAVATGGAATGGTATGGAATGGSAVGAGGHGGAPDLDPCADGEWSCVPVEPAGPYGTRTVEVPANQNWVNTGLYLKAGQTATLTATGSWTVSEAGKPIDHGPCAIGDLVVRIGLHYKDKKLTCVDGAVTFAADKDGILFVGALTGNDLGETYESRYDATGSMTVTVVSSGDTVPTVQAADAAAFDFSQVTSGWVEIWGEHVIMTLPTSTATKDQTTIFAAAERLDAIYELHEELRGAVPHNGQRIRFFPDENIEAGIGWMLAGNPVRMDRQLVTGGDDTRISRAGEEGFNPWGFAHELGHDFSFAPNGFWSYQQNSLEVWCNLFSLHALESLGLPFHGSAASCTDGSTGSYAGGSWDPWTGLCFFRQFQFAYGWDFYKDYFRAINGKSASDMPWKGDWGTTAWHFVHDQFEATSGQDVTAEFAAWNLPHP